MSEHLEQALRVALARQSEAIPSGLAERLRRRDYHPRSALATPRALLAGSTGLAALAAVVALSVAGLGAGAPRAFAGWTPAPEQGTVQQIDAAGKACAGALAGSHGLHFGLGSAGWHRVLGDARGPFTMVLFTAMHNRAEASCLSHAPTSVLSIGASVRVSTPPPVPVGQVSAVSYGSGVTPPSTGSHTFQRMVGRVGSDVAGVTVELSNGDRVVASTGGGWFLAWWPGTAHAVSAEVRTSGGLRAERLGV